MRKKRNSGYLAVWLLAAVMTLGSMLPVSVSAATTVTKKTSAVTISKGQSYHIMNDDIGSNQISSYTITITPKNSKTRFDVAAAAAYTSSDTYQPTETLLRYCNKKVQLKNTAGTFVKSTSSSNSGMLACIYVKKGSVTVQVQYKTTNTSSTKLKYVLQSSDHRTLKSVNVKKGKTIRFKMTNGNLTGTPLILKGKNGYVTNRTLGSKSYEKYKFGSDSLSYSVYSGGQLQSSYSRTLDYDTTYSSSRYILLRTKKRNSSWMTTASGKITYFYPTDYVDMTYTVKTVAN